MSFTLVLLAALVALASVLAYLLYCVGLRARQDRVHSQWLQDFSIERYQPMNRMLAEADYSFLKAQGVDESAAKRFRGQRRRIFRIYLRNLIRDFNRLHWAAQTVLLSSEVDRPELAQRLMRVRVDFQRAVLTLRFRLLLHSLGLGGVDVGRVFGALELLNSDFRGLLVAQTSTAD